MANLAGKKAIPPVDRYYLTMEAATMFVGDAQFDHRQELDVEIDLLAKETSSLRVLVEALYVRERAQLERSAKIKTYLPVLTRRRVKTILQEQRRQ